MNILNSLSSGHKFSIIKELGKVYSDRYVYAEGGKNETILNDTDSMTNSNKTIVENSWQKWTS